MLVNQNMLDSIGNPYRNQLKHAIFSRKPDNFLENPTKTRYILKETSFFNFFGNQEALKKIV